MNRLPRKLSTRKRKFVDSYALSLNATKAALEAGYSARNACNAGYRLARKADVQAAIALKLDESGLTTTRTLKELARIAYSDTGELFDQNGNLKSISELPEHVRSAIASIKVVKRNLVSGDGLSDDIHEVKLWDKTKALEMAAKYLKLFTDQADTNVQIVVSWMKEPNTLDTPKKLIEGGDDDHNI